MINNVDYVPDLYCISFSKLLYKWDDFMQYCVIYHTLIYYILTRKETCEATVRAISIIIRLSNALQRFLTVVRISSYINTACVLRIVSLVFIISSV